ncbi:Arc family DNA-binding protein [Paenibacillus polymyxa]|uniref:Arc family DNA-binding protein n=1 Tax=Paenibacillus polymyxa TaxID=1406 RepID=UPI002AB5AAE2|nr:Arc family DNA-binding protein [Paenibacillus polymyxa]MDY7992524.1 Arc family DNA-binding protein [Paenibacillus polymyxa]MDY8118966.1 Arc family DNA-binding protein [Paenibacillus polymyxa]
MTTNKKAFTLRLKPENFEKIKYIADKNKRSIAKQIEYVLEQHIDEFEEKEAKDKKGDSITQE